MEEKNDKNITSETTNRNAVIEFLVANGFTLEEANKQLLAAEEKAANEQGVHTETEYQQMVAAGNQGMSLEELSQFAEQQLANYNDYEQSDGKIR